MMTNTVKQPERGPLEKVMDEIVLARLVDEALCRALEIAPEEYWVVSEDGGKTGCAWVSPDGPWYRKEDLEAWLETEKARDRHPDHELVCLVQWPEVTGGKWAKVAHWMCQNLFRVEMRYYGKFLFNLLDRGDVLRMGREEGACVVAMATPLVKCLALLQVRGGEDVWKPLVEHWSALRKVESPTPVETCPVRGAELD